MTTKRSIIDQAFAAIGLAGYVFDLQPQQIEMAGMTLDSMCATWANQGIRLGYVPGDIPGESGLPDSAIEAVVANLALRIAPGFGKTVSPDTKIQARIAYSALVAQSAAPIPMRINPSYAPAGAGNWNGNVGIGGPFLVAEPDPLVTGPPNAPLEFE
jgi:hypothetical protein